MSTHPIVYIWDGEAMVPHRRFSRLAESSFTAGQAYRMIVQSERSYASHRQYFAAVHQAWLNLPEHMQLAFPVEDHLRQYALIKAGFCTVRKVVAKGVRYSVDGYAIIVIENGVTTVYAAKSQSYRAMGRKEFQESKQKVIEILADMVNTTPEELMKARAA
jgi:hypothetical protein